MPEVLKKNSKSGYFRFLKKFDCIVIGAGHAGAEAAHITAKAGFQTLLITMNVDTIAQMSCNPAIGGVAKGHIVREVDALGGIMGKAIDRTGIHFKMLNQSKGPAVWSPRAQADKKLYQQEIKFFLENTENLQILQDTVSQIIVKNKKVQGVLTSRGFEYLSNNIIVTTGTFLRGLIHIGEFEFKAGRFGDKSSEDLSASILSMGFPIKRLKTGTPPRIDGKTINYEKTTIQPPDNVWQPFSYENEYAHKKPNLKQINCHITYTNHKMHEYIRKNIGRSPLYSGKIQSTGPRYCPSIEDKIVRFADKERHQIFLEPEGLNTQEVYCNGISTSLPEDIQWKFVRSIPALEEAVIIRPGYAIEYDYVSPTELTPWLETKKINGLFFAGQINGTTGYEEAAGQGLMAGYNVIQKLLKKPAFVLQRDEAYIGVLIDDLVTKGVDEPYRMFTSRAEYRLLLRQDNADKRLMKYAKEIGLQKEIFKEMNERYKKYFEVKKLIKNTKTDNVHIKKLKAKEVEVQKGTTIESIFKRPQITSDIISLIFDFVSYKKNGIKLSQKEKELIAMEIKYEGYIEREKSKTKRRLEADLKKIPEKINYDKIEGLKYEARQKLKKIKPLTIGQASRISGVDPSDIDVLLLYMKALNLKLKY
ncbi:MAG: tRNA uridine-5-carboxymethylaminomethyl(34) synthesis enzyme MnmG [Spirochaetia bacterium]|nr:tRNA uridine-5-carboxymethylaminomethyl(34) synthesis enzyme MnmG [Spirochaetia bacterium]